MATLLCCAPAIGVAGPYYGQGYRNYVQLTDEQQKTFDKLRAEHFKSITPIHEKFRAKSYELRVLSQNPNMKPDELKAMISEREKLRAEMYAARDKFRQKCEKAGLPVPARYSARGGGMAYRDWDGGNVMMPRGRRGMR